MRIETKTVDPETVRKEFKEQYKVFIEILRRNAPQIEELEKQRKVTNEEKTRRGIDFQILDLYTEIARARVIVMREGAVALCQKCGSYAVKYYDKWVDGKLEEYACKVCGFNRLAN